MTDYYTGSEYSPMSDRYVDPTTGQMVQSPVSNIMPLRPYVPVNPINPPMIPINPPMVPINPPMIPNIPGRTYQYNYGSFNWDTKEILKRAIKYLLEGIAVAFVAIFFLRKRLDIADILKLGITAAFVFAILDTFSPTIALGVRFGAGFGIGQSLFGVNPLLMGAPLVGTTLI